MSLPKLAKNFEKATSYSFKNTELLQEALTHPSAIRSRQNVKDIKNSERLEFLGDTVLNLVISDMLFKSFPEDQEGRLTRRRKNLVDGKTLTNIAKSLNICNFILKDVNTGSSCTSKTLENAIEAIIGAIYVDSGFDSAKDFITKYWGTLLREGDAEEDPKSLLQMWSLNNKQPLPSYRTISETGPLHNLRFTVRANVYHLGSATAIASSKKEAQRLAAKMLYDKLKEQDMKSSQSDSNTDVNQLNAIVSE